MKPNRLFQSGATPASRLLASELAGYTSLDHLYER